jgi:hypothetical protein
MAGWTREKRVTFESAFMDFLGEAKVFSKDHGQIVLGEKLYRAQKMFFSSVFDGLEEDIHTFDALKSRQLGISTSTRALTIFWVGMHDGLSSACVFDTDNNRANARREVTTMIRALPESLGFPQIRSDNRHSITLNNDSTITFLSAGVRKGRGTDSLGASLGLTVAHLSELCKYGDEAGLESFRHSLSKIHPNRLVIKESTARGYNLWHDIWQEDSEDPAVRQVFLGWWSKDSQTIRRDEPDFEKYGVFPPTENEYKKIELVEKQYGWKITPEQLAWIRRDSDPAAKVEGDAPPEFTPSVVRLQEQPWVEEDSWQQAGSIFFNPENLKLQADKYCSNKFQSFMFGTGMEFVDMRVYKPPNQKMIELKVWEEPQEECVYVVSCDPAFGSHEDNDRSCIQVLRCYADGCDQVSEYAWPLISTRQLAWVVLAMAGWYAGTTSEVYLIVELNGPGAAVWDEIVSTRQQVMTGGYRREETEARGLAKVVGNIRNYIYSRSDAMASGKSWMWKTSPGTGPSGKVRVMERLRDFVDNSMLRIRSMATLEEMRSVSREGDSIAAGGRNKDDRVMALGLAIRCWEERVRRMMTSAMRTREREHAKQRLTPEDKYKMFNSFQFQAFMKGNQLARARQDRVLRQAQLRARGYRR